jgi:GNAT superfamily N-acetyltransferase
LGEVVLRSVVSADDKASATALALEYGRWAARVAREEYGIDADAETEAGLSTSINELIAPRSSLYIARVSEVDVGIGGLKAVSDDLAEIKRMYVAPAARGLGAGTTILTRLIDDAREYGYGTVRLESAAFMHEAHALYRRSGFVEIEPFAGREFEHIPGAASIQVFMALAVA